MKKLTELIYPAISKYKQAARWVFVCVVVVVAIFSYELGVFKRLELLTVDYRFMLRPFRAEASSGIVFVDMSEDSIEAIGRWPWPRKWHATLVSILSEYGAKVIAFDVIFSETQDIFDDSAFEEAIKKSGVVYLPLLYNLCTQDYRDLNEGKNIVSVLGPIGPFRRWMKGTGHINSIPDRDGIMRRAPPVVDYHGRKTYQFGFKIGCDLLGLREEDVVKKIPTDINGQLIINWQGKWQESFKHYSYIDVIRSYALIREGKKPIIDLNDFRDKVCVVGLTASGLTDIKPIPIESAYPAVGVNATLISNVINNDFVRETSAGVNVLLLFLISTIVTFYLFGLRPLNGLLFASVSVMLYIAVSAVLFNVFNLLIVTFYPLFAIVFSYGLTASYVQILSSIERAQLFSQATRDGLTRLYNIRHFNRLLEAEFRNVSLYKNRRLSVIMVDVDNFKHINDTYGHPAGDMVLKEFARIVQSKCRQIDVVARYGGEEFIIMLVGAGKGWSFGIAEKIRTAIKDKKFDFEGKQFSTTVSLGGVEFSDEKTKEELIEKADKALYMAKFEGKNKVCMYGRAD